MYQAVNNCLFCKIVSFVVTGHHGGPRATYLSNLTDAALLSLLIKNPHLKKRGRDTHGTHLSNSIVLVKDRDETLGQAIKLIETAWKQFV